MSYGKNASPGARRVVYILVPARDLLNCAMCPDGGLEVSAEREWCAITNTGSRLSWTLNRHPRDRSTMHTHGETLTVESHAKAMNSRRPSIN